MTIFPGQTNVRVSVRSLVAAAVLLGATLSCNSPMAPRAGVTLLVTNATCSAGTCDPLEVFAFPTGGPATPGGPWALDLGTLTAPQGCFTLPSSAMFRIIGGNANGTIDTTTFVWTNAHAASLGALPPSQVMPSSVWPSTPTFVPARAAGWSITLPGSATAMPSVACTP